MDDFETLDRWIDEGAIDIPQGGWESAEAPEKLLTTGLGPCAGVLVHNPKARKAALGHFVEPRMKLEGFAELVRHARDEMGRILDQIVVLAGVSPEDRSKEAQEESREIRRHIVRAFVRAGYSEAQIRQAWNGLDELSNLAVDTESGKVICVKKDYSGLVG